ncbi:MAG: hypothetical protein KME11_05180 [Timaviella obliquedivisa GSE-PSE-MK23-08B]|jgi:hypothetical protein|nr:hypothetical protein [Timaviella obliquedivisa GSE-PSE-MK23-08B]
MHLQNRGNLSRRCHSKEIKGVQFEVTFERCNSRLCPVVQIDSATHQIEIRQGVTRLFLGQIDLRMPSNSPDDIALFVIDRIEKRLIRCTQKDCIGLSKTTSLFDQNRLASMFWASQLIDITKSVLYEILLENNIPRTVYAKHREVYLQAFPP